jgi:hypothetical protein
LGDLVISDDEIKHLPSDGGTDGREQTLGALEVVSHQSVNTSQRGLLVTMLDNFSTLGTRMVRKHFTLRILYFQVFTPPLYIKPFE